MLRSLVPLVVALAAPSPVPVQSAPPAPLQQIGHVESLSVCSAIVVHANSAISVALDNDRDLALTINRLQTTDLDDDNEIKRRNGMNDLSTLASRIRLAAAAGTGEIKRLRTMAAQTADPARKAELKAFADALGGAIARQRKAGTDLDRMLAIIDGRRAVEEVDANELGPQQRSISDPELANASAAPGIMRTSAAPPGPVAANEILRGVADDFRARTQDILSDEGVAAEHSLGATTGC